LARTESFSPDGLLLTLQRQWVCCKGDSQSGGSGRSRTQRPELARHPGTS